MVEDHTAKNVSLDLFVIGNPLLDISIYREERSLLDKYRLKFGHACLADEQ